MKIFFNFFLIENKQIVSKNEKIKKRQDLEALVRGVDAPHDLELVALALGELAENGLEALVLVVPRQEHGRAQLHRPLEVVEGHEHEALRAQHLQHKQMHKLRFEIFKFFYFCFFFISINQKDECHTSAISSKGYFIHLFKINKIKI